MSIARAAAIARHDLRIMRRDPSFVIVMTLMPLVVMAFVREGFQASLVAAGFQQVNGAEQAIPGMAVTFSFFLVGTVGFAIFREHGWNTWDRLRASQSSAAEILLGKMIVPSLASLLQLTVLFGAGAALFDLRVRGSWFAIAILVCALIMAIVTLGLALTGMCRTVMQLSAMTNLGTMVMAGLGGALTPIDTLPDWAHAVAPGFPTYWAMRGFRSVILDGAGVVAVLPQAGILMAFAAGFAGIARLSFRIDREKTFAWA